MTVNGSRSDGDIRETIRRFVARSVMVPDLADDDDLFESGLVNSLFAVQLMTFIEKTFAIEVEADDLDIANFKSLNAATSFVLKKSAGKAA
jgi:methoxymalonate biosynthesis acyl carrier protein